MFIVGGNQSAGGYEVDNSLRFNDGSSDTLSRTPGSASNRRTWTWSGWIKRGNLGTDQVIFVGGTANTWIRLNADDTLEFNIQDNDESTIITTQLFRDVSAWYHIVVAIDTTQGTASNRVKFYVNGNQVTDFSTEVYPSLNYQAGINNTGTHYIGRLNYVAVQYIDMYLSETVFIDGQQLDPTSFGEFDEDSGIWKPIDVSGLTFGTNGFYLPFENSAALGQDDSGNGNNFTVNNLTAIDQSTDTPTNNFATWNPLDIKNPSYVNTLSNGNLTASDPSTGDWYTTFANFSPSKGKWYWEVKPTTLSTTCGLGIYFGQNTFTTIYPNTTTSFYCHQNGDIYMNSTTYTYMASYSVNDIIIFALDMDDGKFYMGKNGSWADGSGNSNQTFANAVSLTTTSSTSFPTDKDVFPITSLRSANANINFGSPPYTISSGNTDGNGYGNFEYAVPSGYYALNTKNLAEYG